MGEEMWFALAMRGRFVSMSLCFSRCGVSQATRLCLDITTSLALAGGG